MKLLPSAHSYENNFNTRFFSSGWTKTAKIINVRFEMIFLLDLLPEVFEIREFKKLRRQLQRKRHIKIELCVKIIFSRLSRVDHVVQNR